MIQTLGLMKTLTQMVMACCQIWIAMTIILTLVQSKKTGTATVSLHSMIVMILTQMPPICTPTQTQITKQMVYWTPIYEHYELLNDSMNPFLATASTMETETVNQYRCHHRVSL